MTRLPNICGKRIPGSVLALVLCVSAVNSAKANPEVFQKTVRATAWILSPSDDGKTSMGTGVVIDVERRLVLTNYHVVRDRPRALLFFAQFDRGELVTDPEHYLDRIKTLGVRGRVIETQPVRDLAIIEVEKLPEGVQAIELAPRSPTPGQTVHAIGNSGANDGTLWRYIKGDVRSVYRKKFQTGGKTGDAFEIQARVIETDSATNGGDSGGPVVDDKGRLVGITQGYDGACRAVSYSIDLTEIRTLVANLGNPKAKAERLAKKDENKPARDAAVKN
jgi:S1-C subfamily serine protease